MLSSPPLAWWCWTQWTWPTQGRCWQPSGRWRPCRWPMSCNRTTTGTTPGAPPCSGQRVPGTMPCSGWRPTPSLMARWSNPMMSGRLEEDDDWRGHIWPVSTAGQWSKHFNLFRKYIGINHGKGMTVFVLPQQKVSIMITRLFAEFSTSRSLSSLTLSSLEVSPLVVCRTHPPGIWSEVSKWFLPWTSPEPSSATTWSPAAWREAPRRMYRTSSPTTSETVASQCNGNCNWRLVLYQNFEIYFWNFIVYDLDCMAKPILMYYNLRWIWGRSYICTVRLSNQCCWFKFKNSRFCNLWPIWMLDPQEKKSHKCHSSSPQKLNIFSLSLAYCLLCCFFLCPVVQQIYN